MPTKRHLAVGLGVAIFLCGEVARADQLTLDKALAEARGSAPDLAIASARVSVANAGFASANKLLRTNPTLSLGFGTDAPFGNDGDRSWSFGISQTIEIGGQQGLRRDIVKADSAEAVADKARVRNELLADVVVTFYALDGARRGVAIEKEIAAIYKRLLATVRVSLEKGGGNKLDVTTMEIEFARVEADLAKSNGLVAALEAQLAGLMGRTGGTAIEPATDDAPKIESYDTEALVAKALADRPELLAARARRRSFTVQGRLVAREVWLSPTLSIGVRHDRTVYGVEGFRTAPGGVPGLFGVDTRFTMLSVDLSIPLPFFEQKNTEIARASAGADVASAEERAWSVRIEAEVRAAVAMAKGTGEAFAIHEKVRPTTTEAAALFEAAYVKGQYGLSETLLGEERVLRARLLYLAARADYLKAKVLVKRATGEWMNG